MKPKMEITLAMLEKKRACLTQMALFKSIFGEKVTLTKKMVKYAPKFHIFWAGDVFLTAENRAKYMEEDSKIWIALGAKYPYKRGADSGKIYYKKVSQYRRECYLVFYNLLKEQGGIQ